MVSEEAVTSLATSSLVRQHNAMHWSGGGGAKQSTITVTIERDDGD